jgi:CheY-like chemotaxis protein
MRDTRRVRSGQGSLASHPVRVVIADDDRMFANALRAQLAGHDDIEVVGIANHGCEAVKLAKAFRPDLVLMDVHMPVLDGIEATRHIKKLPGDIAVVLVTGEDEMSDARAYEAGANGYLRKSDDFVSIVDMVVVMSRVARVGG